jgi:histidinol dehydrogenase
MQILQKHAAGRLVQALEARGSRLEQVEPAARRIVEGVRRNGDRALRKYAGEFDGLQPKQDVMVNESELAQAWNKISPELKQALRKAEKNIRRFCEWQKPKTWTRSQKGMSLGQVIQPLASVGCYVPGGRFPLVSTLLMTVIPAQVAGVKRICVASPGAKLETMAAAAMLGISEFYRVGGAQAIAALAYGTETLPRVDKIVGPGNLYVTAAKKAVAFDCAIDMLAGPTETLIVSDRGNPAFIAADLLAQAEHDPEALALLITTSRELGCAVQREVEAGKSGRSRTAVLIASSREQAFTWANRIAPEHITVEKRDLQLVQNAGSIFIGVYSAQAAGDYVSGPNHVLPTGGAARFRGGLSVMDFVKAITVQELSPAGLRRIAPAVVRLAEAEGLEAHAESIRARWASA